MRKTLLFALMLGLGFSAFAQTTYTLKINHKLGSADFAMSQTAQNDMDHDFNVKRLEYYLSGFELVHDGGKTTKLGDVYALVNAATSTAIDLTASGVTTVEAIRFAVGVDAGVNNGDPTQWPRNHALAPKSPSMHWGWSAGYRFVAMEGKAGNNLAYTYEVHALGNQNYFPIEIPVSESGGTIELNADYTKALSKIGVSSGLITHGAYDEAITMLRNFQNNVFTSLDGKGNTLSTNDLALNRLSVFPNPSSGKVAVLLPTNTNGKIQVLDLSGRLIKQQSLTGVVSELIIEEKGIYVVQVVTESGLRHTKRLVIH